jgi:SAM-dependent methyltransferase
MYIFQIDRYLLKKQIKNFSSFITGKVLDIGAGNVSRYEKLFSSNEYLKMDVFKGDNIDFVGTADNIPINDSEFDSVVCTQVFEHLKNPRKSAREIYRILKKGGYCLVTVPQINELHEEPNDFFRYTKYGIEYIFKKEGFAVIEYDQRGGFFVSGVQMFSRYFIDRFKLYNKKILGRLFSYIFKIIGFIALFLDKIDRSKANKKHALGWIFILKKQ